MELCKHGSRLGTCGFSNCAIEFEKNFPEQNTREIRLKRRCTGLCMCCQELLELKQDIGLAASPVRKK